MRVGLIDVGSNTVKLAVYQIQNGSYRLLDFQPCFAYLAGAVENGLLAPRGVEALCAALEQLLRRAQTRKVDALDCFSTASLRDIQNQAEVLAAVRERTGLVLHPLTGQEEAHYNLLSLRRQTSAACFLGQDLGGGSTQLFTWLNGAPGPSQSLPLGALRLKTQFVSGELPTPEEAEALSAYAADVLSQARIFDGLRFDTVYLMGGSARLLSRLLGDARGRLSRAALEQKAAFYLSHREEARADILSVDPGRLVTAVPGMLILAASAKRFGAENLVVTQGSVREGRLIETMQREKYSQEEKQ